MTPEVEKFRKQYLDIADSIVVHTSGSTGTPKSVHLPKQMMRESALRTNSFFGIDSDSVLYSCVSPEFIGGKMMVVRAIEAGCRYIFETPSNRPLLKADRIDLLAVVPSQMLHIISNLPSLPPIRNIIIGGQRIPLSLREAIALSGLNAYETYGMTETASHIALRKVSADDIPFELLPGIGISADCQGRLAIDISGQHIVTNDVTKIMDQRHFYITGRSDNVIVSGGRKLHPESIENRLEPLFPGRHIAVGSVPHDKWGSAMILLVEGDYIPDPETLQQMRDVLQPWEFPKGFATTRHFPLTTNGKTDRKRAGEIIAANFRLLEK